jgi:hypothetical protein
VLILTVTLVPGGFELLRRDIGTLRISNISEVGHICDYSVDVVEAANPLIGAAARIGGCRVEAHDRIQSVWALIERAAAAAQTADLVEL